MEPINLKHWQFSDSSGNDAYFYTCARPGRSMGQDESVPQISFHYGSTGFQTRLT